MPFVKKKMGRPPVDATLRDSQVGFMLTPDDHAELKRTAKRLGFKSTSAMMTAITERLLIGGFSGLSFLKLGYQFVQLINKLPREDQAGFYFGVRQLPPLLGEGPDTQEFAKELKKFAANEVENDLQKRAA